MKNSIDKFWKNTEKGISRVLEKTAHRIRENIRELILARRTPSGGQQKDNADLFSTGVLADHTKYRIVRKGVDLYVIYPPTERKKVIEILRSEGYELFEVPSEAPKWLEEFLREEFK